MEDLVQPKPRIDLAREFVRLGDDRLERGPDECVAVCLTAGQGASVTAKERQVWSEFLAQRHKRLLSVNCDLLRLWRRVRIVATLEGPFLCRPFAAPMGC